MLKQSVKEALILMLAALAIAVAVYAIRPDKIPPGTQSAVESTVDASAEAYLALEISIEEAWDLFHATDAIFADSRHRADFEVGHIQGAVHLYTADADTWLSDLLTTTDPMTPLVAYCDGEDCQLARELAELLLLNGFENARYLKNGWTRWRERGWPVESSQ